MFAAIIAADKPGMNAVRAATKERHRVHLDAGGLGVKVLQAGPLLSPEGTERGSLIVVSADRLDAVEKFVASDPYSVAGLFDKVEIHAWDWRRGNPYL